MSLRDLVANSWAARVAAVPVRVRDATRHIGREIAVTARWLVRSKEHTNYTYELTALNREHLAWFLSGVTNAPVETIRGYFAELESDSDLVSDAQDAIRSSGRRGLVDSELRFARRLGWYALVRQLRPQTIVESGTDKGLGTIALAAAVLRNGSGRVITLDINPRAGVLLTARYASVVDFRIGDAVQSLTNLDEAVDLFVQDGNHDPRYEVGELGAIEAHLAPGAVVLSDNADITDVLMQWSEARKRRFAYFAEQPRDHWYPGGGIGLSYEDYAS